jgi:hypothetical protein
LPAAAAFPLDGSLEIPVSIARGRINMARPIMLLKKIVAGRVKTGQ